MRSFLLHGVAVLPSLVSSVVFTLALIVSPVSVLGAGLVFSPGSGSYQPGATFTVSVFVDSAGEALNAVSGVVSFPKGALEVVSVSKNQSIISLWVEEPYFSNEDGTVHFEGIVLNPGYVGSNGKILDVTFAAAGAGAPVLTFSAGSVLANDGEGSEILTSRGRAQFTIASAPTRDTTPDDSSEAPNTTESLVPALLPEVVPVDSSPTGWLAGSTGVFNFALPEGVVAMRLLLDTESDSVPTVVYQPPIASKTIEGLEEGLSYLHVQYKNAAGWGDVLHHEIRTDTTAPNTPIVKVIRQDTFLLSALDEVSGVERFEIDIDGGEKFTLSGEAATVFVIPASLTLSRGQHALTVRVFDHAGNSTLTTTPFEYIPTVTEGGNDEHSGAIQDRESPVYSLLVPNGAILITILSVIVPLLGLIILLGILVYAVWRALGGLKRRIEREAKEASEIVRRAFFMLRSDLEVDIETLKKANLKRKLTREESKILKRLQANINTAEQVIGKEIADIEKEVQ